MALTFRPVDTWDDGKRIRVAATAASGDPLDGRRCARLSQFPIIAVTQASVKSIAWMRFPQKIASRLLALRFAVRDV
jgi:hypothetical protein